MAGARIARCALLLCATEALLVAPSSSSRSVARPLLAAAASRSVAQPQRGRAGRSLVTCDAGSFFEEGVRSPARTAGVLALWLSLAGYVAVGAPGNDVAAKALDAELLAKLIANPFDPTVSPLFCVVFNYMGIWPAIYAALLLPGANDQKPLPATPFLLGSVALGMFALSPYVALRERRVEACTAPVGLAGRWFESKANAALLAAGAVGLAGYAATAGDFSTELSEYASLFNSQLFVHVTSLDFLSLWALSFGVMAEDAERRDADDRLKFLAAVPIFGALTYLLVRPPLPPAAE